MSYKKIPGVYKLTCIDGRIYFGSTNDYKNRIRQHTQNYDTPNPKTPTWMRIVKRRYDKPFNETFTCELLEVIEDKEEREKREQELIVKYNTTDKNIGFNTIIDGNKKHHISWVNKTLLITKPATAAKPIVIVYDIIEDSVDEYLTKDTAANQLGLTKNQIDNAIQKMTLASSRYLVLRQNPDKRRKDVSKYLNVERSKIERSADANDAANISYNLMIAIVTLEFIIRAENKIQKNLKDSAIIDNDFFAECNDFISDLLLTYIGSVARLPTARYFKHSRLLEQLRDILVYDTFENKIIYHGDIYKMDAEFPMVEHRRYLYVSQCKKYLDRYFLYFADNDLRDNALRRVKMRCTKTNSKDIYQYYCGYFATNKLLGHRKLKFF